MEFAFTEEQKLLRKSVREFAEQVVQPRVEHMEETAEFPWDIVEEMADLGLMGIVVPEEYGGTGLGHVARLIALEQIGRVSAAVAVILQVHHLSLTPIIDFGTEEQKQRYLPPLARGDRLISIAVTEPSGGSDVMGMETAARLDGDAYILNGRKCFISTNMADYSVVLVKMEDDTKGPLSAFIIPKETEGFQVGRREHKIGLRGQVYGDIVLNNCRVPKENLIGAEGEGLKVGLKAIGEVGRAGMAAAALGILNACLEDSVRFAKERILYGEPISKLQAIQLLIADIYESLEASRLLCRRAAWMKDQGLRCDTEWALAKHYTTEAAVRCAKKAIDIHGGYGILEEYPVQRYLRDAQVCISSAGTSQIMRLVMARRALS